MEGRTKLLILIIPLRSWGIWRQLQKGEESMKKHSRTHAPHHVSLMRALWNTVYYVHVTSSSWQEILWDFVKLWGRGGSKEALKSVSPLELASLIWETSNYGPNCELCFGQGRAPFPSCTCLREMSTSASLPDCQSLYQNPLRTSIYELDEDQ